MYGTPESMKEWVTDSCDFSWSSFSSLVYLVQLRCDGFRSILLYFILLRKSWAVESASVCAPFVQHSQRSTQPPGTQAFKMWMNDRLGGEGLF